MTGKSRISKKPHKISGRLEGGRRFLEVLLFLLCLFVCLAGGSRAEASSATISVETKNDKVTEGETLYVIITVRSAKAIKGFEGYFSYDNRYLRFESGGGVVHGNDDAFRILDMERSASAGKLKYSVKFTARKAGATSISLKKPYHVLEDDGSNTKMSVSFNELNMLIEKPQSQPSQKPQGKQKPKDNKNQNKAQKQPSPRPQGDSGEQPSPGQKDITGSSKLRSLEIQGTQLTPEFSPDIEKYSGVISTSREELPITYQTEDSQAQVKISGNQRIKEGKNVLKVTVRSTTGRKTTYRLSMTVQKITPEEESENSRVDVVERSGKLYVVGTTTICAGEADAEEIPDGFERISMEVAGKNMICYALEGDKEMPYVLIYGEEEKAFYLYDRETGALYSYEKVKMWYQSSGRQEISNSAALEEKIESYGYMLAIMGIFCLLMLVLMLYFALHSRKYRE